MTHTWCKIWYTTAVILHWCKVYSRHCHIPGVRYGTQETYAASTGYGMMSCQLDHRTHGFSKCFSDFTHHPSTQEVIHSERKQPCYLFMFPIHIWFWLDHFIYLLAGSFLSTCWLSHCNPPVAWIILSTCWLSFIYLLAGSFIYLLSGLFIYLLRRSINQSDGWIVMATVPGLQSGLSVTSASCHKIHDCFTAEGNGKVLNFWHTKS